MGLENFQKLSTFGLAKAHFALLEYDKAVPLLHVSLKLAEKEGDKEHEGRVYGELGDVYHQQNQYSEAMKWQQRHLKLSKQRGDKLKESQAYQKLGAVSMESGRYEESLNYSTRALDIAMVTENEEHQACAYSNLGLYHKQMEDFDKALECFNKSLSLSHKMGNKKGEAAVYGNLGNLYQSQGKFSDAIAFHSRQLNIAREIRNKSSEASSHIGLGVDYKSIGNYTKALEYYQEGLKIYEERGNKEGQATLQSNVANVYRMLGETTEAIDCLHKSIRLAKEIGHREMEMEGYSRLGSAFHHLGKLQESQGYFEKALVGYESVGSGMGQGKLCGELGSIYHSLGDDKKAMEFHKKSLQLSEERSRRDVISQLSATMEIGNIYLQGGEYHQGIEYFEKGRQLAKQIKDKRTEAQCCAKLGSAFSKCSMDSLEMDERQHDEYLQKSIDVLKECLSCYDWVFDHIQEYDEFKVSIFETFIINYKILSLLLQKREEVIEALLVSERGRARALEDLLASKYSIDKDATSDQEPISYTAVEKMASKSCIMFCDYLHSGLSTWIIGPGSPSVFHVTLPTNIVTNAYSALKVREAQCEDRSIPTRDEQQEKQKPVVPQNRSAMDIPENAALLSIFESFKQRCVAEDDLNGDDDCLSPLEELYKSLISPLMDKLTKDEIVIIPDGPLFNVPFAALQDPDTGSFLSETKRIRLAPSLTSLKALQESPADFHSKAGALIIGNPQVGEVMFRGKKREISDLPCAEQEAQMIGELLGVKPFIGPQATKEAIKQNLREGVAIIHFAAHGTTDGEIFLTPSTTCSLPNEQDYILTMKDVQESGVRPQLVVLSCCHSGRGEVKAEGVVGMSRAFLAAGARAVVASLWAIADEATMIFMEKFYKHLKEGESASKSLQQAMKDMRDVPKYSDPKFWAPFFLIGDDVTIDI
ncbi:hypothetical protein QZH41_005764 [Actinostola sp. cb2023]|nr:hypothetical protein QZH41_005764 [Actinostola sp. cb2023]